MSTKETVAYGNNFHLYKEGLDTDSIYLELEGVQFEASYNRVTVSIPVHVWEVIRQYPGVNLSWADKTDEEIIEYVEAHVDERIKRLEEAENSPNKRLIALIGSIPYGTADSPRIEQIEKGIEHYKSLRKHQQQIKDAIAEIKKINQKSALV